MQVTGDRKAIKALHFTVPECSIQYFFGFGVSKHPFFIEKETAESTKITVNSLP